MGSKLRIIALIFLTTSVYAMSPTKHPEYDQAFEQYIQEAERPIPQSTIPQPEQPMQSVVKPTPVIIVPDYNTVTEKDIHIPKYYRYLPQTYRDKLIEKRIKRKQAEINK